MTPRTPDERERSARADGGRLREQLRERGPAALDASDDDGREQAEEDTSDEPQATGAGVKAQSGAAEATLTDAAPESDADVAEPGAEGAEPSPQGEGADPLAELTRERDDYLALAKRTQADFENYRKRAAKDMAAAGGRARVGLIREILPVVDNLERALASAPDSDAGLAEGVRMVLSELQGVLARAGVAAIEPDGDQFDPQVHEALTTREQEGADSGLVLAVVEKGYKTDDVVIRPARVVVAA